jgi:hypothetical protein
MKFQPRGVTMIDNLPDLDDLDNNDLPSRPNPMERQIMNRPEIQDDKYLKYIRPPTKMSPYAGMDPSMPPMHRPMRPLPSQQEVIRPREVPTLEQQPQLPHYLSFSCIDISKHIQECPICSRFYNNDKTVYVIVIIVLSIISLLLLKRVLSV